MLPERGESPVGPWARWAPWVLPERPEFPVGRWDPWVRALQEFQAAQWVWLAWLVFREEGPLSPNQ